MQAYLRSIRNSALAILDGGQPWNGGIFKLIGENRILYNAIANKTVDTKLITNSAKSSMLSGGSLIAIIFTVLLILMFLALIIVSIYCRCKSSSKKYLSSRLQSRVRRVNQQLPISLRLLIGILCVIVLILAIVPLVLAFATNSRLHASVSDSDNSRFGTVTNQISQLHFHVDTFLKNLVPEAREDVKPVIQRTLEMTAEMKNKSQSAYQQAFRDMIGANELMAASTNLLDRIQLYYYAGKELRVASEAVSTALSSLQHIHFNSYETVCNLSLDGSEKHICTNHTATINTAITNIKQVKDSWTTTVSSDDRTLQNAMKDMSNFLGQLVGALDATKNTPDKQQKLKEEKLNLSVEFNQNITAVFDQELNSTAFVLDGVDKKLSEMEEKISLGRDALQKTFAKVQGAFVRSSFKFESIRFGATTGVNVLLLITLTILSTAAAVILLMPNSPRARSRGLIGIVYFSYVVYAVALLFVCVLFCATSYLRTETCRYMYEEKTADRFLVPEINAVIADMKAQAASDPNKTDAIPLKGVGRLIGGLLDGCKANQPIVVALDAVDLIDTEISDSAQQSMEFKEKGRDILRREMSKANLEQLRDPSMESKMGELQKIFLSYATYPFSALGAQLENQTDLLGSTQRTLLNLKVLNTYISTWLPASEDSTKKLSIGNQRSIENGLGAIEELLNVTRWYSSKLVTLEREKQVTLIIDSIIANNKKMDGYLSNQTAWTELAVQYYTMHVIDGSTEESKTIADNTAIGILSKLGKCREIYNFYRGLIDIPCETLLYPMSILWFCLAWFLWFAALLSILVHLSLGLFVDSSTSSQQQQQPIDNELALHSHPTQVTNTPQDPATKSLLLPNPV